MKNSEITFTVTDILGLQIVQNFNRILFLKGPWRSGLQAVEKKLEKMGLHCNA
jgi:hypothetical protein